MPTEFTKTFEKGSEYENVVLNLRYELFEDVVDPAEWHGKFAAAYGADVVRDMTIAKAKISLQTKAGNLFKKDPTMTEANIQQVLDGWKLGEVTRTVGLPADVITENYLNNLRKTDPEGFEALMERHLSSQSGEES